MKNQIPFTSSHPATIAKHLPRFLAGMTFITFGVNYWANFLPMPTLSGPAAAFIGALYSTGYLTVIKALEIIAGTLLLSRRMTPHALLVLVPITVNIVLFDTLLVRQFNPAGAFVALMIGITVYQHRHLCEVIRRTQAERIDAEFQPTTPQAIHS